MKRPKVGSVYTFPITEDLDGYLEFLGNHPMAGQCSLFWLQNSNVKTSDEKFIFYPVTLNVRKGILQFVELRTPSGTMPLQVRRPGIVRNGLVEWWFLDIGPSTVRVDDLSDIEGDLPVAAVMSHAVLTEWLAGGWEYLYGPPPRIA